MAGLNMGSAGIALLGLLAVKGFQHKDEIGRMLGDMSANRGGTSGAAGAGGLGGMLGGLGDMLSGRQGGSVINEGLGGLLDRFKQTGHGDEADSWVQTGPNKPVQPAHLEAALGEDVIEHLQQQTGLSRSELMQRLSTNLPQAVNRLTPEGRLPTTDETDGWARA
ncbi:MAG TPA: YidB family protein [Devosia sp.]|jgi:uncharacterized protein YidB (DUF937 family)|uniref:YidB family protein n=1 Tax=Devosia sp. TaxID=1871048 RepID=UPI002F925D69